MNQLVQRALEQRALAYAPYSSFAVGAALQTIDGHIFTGCNIENSSLGLSICAERVAITNAVAAGYREFSKIVIVASPLAAPCGACRQFMSEFFDDQVSIQSLDAENPDHSRSWTITELMPDQFRFGK